MSIRSIIRVKLVEKLPTKYRFFIERLYLYYFVSEQLKSDLKIIKQLCNPYKASLDVGTNDGTITLFLCKFSSHAYCFEPIPRWSEYLRQKFNGCNVTVEECALGNSDGYLCMNIPYVSGQKWETRGSLIKDFENELIFGEKVTDVERLTVRTRRLDDFNISNIGFIKIDVEGFEFEVLKGGENTIKKEMPNMFIEIEQRHHKKDSIYDIFQYVVNLGYFAYFIHNGKIKAIEEFNLEKMQKEDDEKTDDYIHNFIFSPISITNLKL